jgi:AcrR family transcriptional regulator
MPTRRFQALPPDRQAHLLASASAEFAEHGYESASLNRIIERSGTSKGVFYYYFEDKADLYATVVRDAVDRMLAACGTLQPTLDPEGFWDQVAGFTRRAMRFYRSDPHIAGLILSLARDGLKVGPVAEIRATADTWFRALVLAGQALGAIRADLPLDLMVSVGTAMTQGVDLWLAEHVSQLSDAELDRLADQLVALYRRMAIPGGP